MTKHYYQHTLTHHVGQAFQPPGDPWVEITHAAYEAAKQARRVQEAEAVNITEGHNDNDYDRRITQSRI